MNLPLDIKNKIESLIDSYKISDLKRASKNISDKYLNESGRGDRLVISKQEVLTYAVIRMPATFAAFSKALEYTLELIDDDIESVLDLGATPTAALFKVVLPEIVPGVLSGFMLAITLSLDDYIITAFTMPKSDFDGTISTYVEQVTRKDGLPVQLRAFTALLFFAILVVMIVYNIYISRKGKERK